MSAAAHSQSRLIESLGQLQLEVCDALSQPFLKASSYQPGLTRILENGAVLCRHHRTLLRLALALEVIADIRHGHPLYAWFSADVLDQSRARF